MAEGPTIGGMTFDSYDSERDPLGEIGHALADAELARRGGFTSKEPVDSLPSLRGYDLERVVRLALIRLPASAPGERAGAYRQKVRLSLLRGAGYPLEPYSQMSTGDICDYFDRVVNQVRSLARRDCPALLAHIDEKNRRFEAEDELMR